MGELREAVELVVRGPANLVGAGRTDAGVHGWGQVVSCDIPDGFDLAKLQRRVNSMCRPHIAVRDFEWTDDPEFNARYSATWRLYRYHVLNADGARTRSGPHGLARAAAVAAVGDEAGVRPADRRARLLIVLSPAEAGLGEHERSMRRRVFRAEWKEVPGDVPGLLRFEIGANAFCHQMVRSIVGTLVDVGMGKLHAGEMRGILLQPGPPVRRPGGARARPGAVGSRLSGAAVAPTQAEFRGHSRRRLPLCPRCPYHCTVPWQPRRRQR